MQNNRPPRQPITKQIQTAAQDILNAAKKRPRVRQPASLSCYQQAKAAETNERNLSKAALLYGQAAKKGEKVDSCIKDFASILHQMGATDQAIIFLRDARSYYRGDLQKFDRLLTTLQKQLEPSGKHHCKNILLELPDPVEPSPALLSTLFTNTTRIKGAKAYSHLNFEAPPSQMGKWVVLQFDSFSAAKKTLEKFDDREWFGVSKFWLRGGMVVCIATDGREDFEKRMLSQDELEDRVRRGSWRLLSRQKRGRLDLLNRLAIGLLEGAQFDDPLA